MPDVQKESASGSAASGRARLALLQAARDLVSEGCERHELALWFARPDCPLPEHAAEAQRARAIVELRVRAAVSLLQTYLQGER